LRLLINGDSSWHGDVSLELAVLDPPPGDCTAGQPVIFPLLSAVGINRERPLAGEAPLFVADDLDLCLTGGVRMGGADGAIDRDCI